MRIDCPCFYFLHLLHALCARSWRILRILRNWYCHLCTRCMNCNQRNGLNFKANNTSLEGFRQGRNERCGRKQIRSAHCYFLKAFTVKFFERALIMLTYSYTLIQKTYESLRLYSIAFETLNSPRTWIINNFIFPLHICLPNYAG